LKYPSQNSWLASYHQGNLSPETHVDDEASPHHQHQTTNNAT
jgi:hypothetical protein